MERDKRGRPCDLFATLWRMILYEMRKPHALAMLIILNPEAVSTLLTTLLASACRPGDPENIISGKRTMADFRVDQRTDKHPNSWEWG